jgi:hypothetical protein
MLAFSSNHSRTNTAESICSFTHIDRCKNLPTETTENEISFFLMSSYLGNRKEIARLGQAALAEVHGSRFDLRPRHLGSMKQRCFVDSCSAAGKLTRPTKSSRLRISFTKTSPQQTDPPVR